MKRLFLLATLILLGTLHGSTQPDFVQFDYPLDYFLPKALPDLKNGGEIVLEQRFDKRIPQPNQVLEFELGEQAADYNDILNYMYALDRASDRVSIRKYGKTYENRRFIQVVITSAKNQRRLEALRNEHLALSDSHRSDQLNIADMPVVVNLVSSIHGREPSGVNAALAVAYFFAASQDKTIGEMLDNCILLLTPGMAPDGVNKYATWLNYANSGNQTPDSNSREFLEPWPRSYFNHYWHDANRDMLMCQHPEGKNAVRMYLDWMPNVINDHHEQNSDLGLFYSPGDPRRNHPLIPQRNQELTAKIGTYTAAMLNSIDQPNFSGVKFDDYYLGKNSAYGDVQGSVGILIEQVRSDSYIRHWRGGLLDLPMTMRNQAFVGVSTVLAACQMREELLAYQRDFFRQSAQEAANDHVKGYVFRAQGGHAVAYHFLENMKEHEIEVYHLAKPVTIEGTTYTPKDSYIIPLNQKFYAKFRALWEDAFEFEDVTFYDVTTWSFKRAFNLQNTPLSTIEGLLGEKAEPRFVAGTVKKSPAAVGYLFEAGEFYSHNLLTALLQQGVRVSVARHPFSLNNKQYGCGTAIVALAEQRVEADKVEAILAEAARTNGVQVETIDQLPTEKAALREVRLPKVAMVLGHGFSAYLNGEVWFMLDRRFGLTPTRIDFNRLHMIQDLDQYNVITLMDGTTEEPVAPESYTLLRDWVARGGTLIVVGSAIDNIDLANLGTIKQIPQPQGGGDAEKNFGIIVKATLDTASPIGYGYAQTEIPVFKRNTIAIDRALNPSMQVPMRYTSTPLLSGCISKNNLERFSDTPTVVVSRCGEGRVIYFVDNMNFRSYWFATMKLFMNAVYFGDFYE